MKRLCPRKEILIVDDDEVSRYYAESVIRKESTFGVCKYRITTASNGADAYEIIEELKPSLIITDLLMFHMNGFELIAKLHASELYKNIPVIVLSCLDDSETRENVDKLKINAFIRKPYTPETLISAIHNLLK